MKKQLAIWLEGPLQSWGCNTENEHHGTMRFPTKSGVIGLLLASMGEDGSDAEKVERMASCDMTVYSFCKKETSILHDFHTAGAGWAEYVKDSWKSKMIRKNRKGGKNPNAVIMKKDYLEGVVFSVVFQMENDLLEKVSNSLQYPTWPLYLGRRNCFPTEPIFLGVSEDVSQMIFNKAAEKGLVLKEVIAEGRIEGSYDSFVLNDVPLLYYPERLFSERWISIKRET